ncbi:AK6 [Cordylochernes scorpioides]|uniref:AK6 n=1 Tax=Cordylochernes scorpioides TaxID=51811 RepID=A0ABY6LUE7_9ARAC|nr:AK6 [Cordylochernes scorpioides]
MDATIMVLKPEHDVLPFPHPGTPGTGKSTFSHELSNRTGMQCINISEVAIRNGFISGYDAQLNSHILNEDRFVQVIHILEPTMAQGGKIVEYHSSEFFPERWFQLVIVLQTDNNILHNRLVER